MKSEKIVLIALLAVSLFSCKQGKIVELPLTAQVGYGQFKSGLGGISPVSEDENNPYLRELYSKADTAKFVIIGIAGDNQPITLTDAIEKHKIAWSQIISDDTNKIKEKYGISGYPTTFLINTEGIVIAKDLRGKELEEKVLSLINEQK